MGVDPGTIAMGVGVVDYSEGNLELVYSTCIKSHRNFSLPNRLHSMYEELLRLIHEFQPDTVAVEQPFVATNPKSALAIGQAQAVVLLSAARNQLSVTSYTPREVKKSVTDYGQSSKEQVKAMVCTLLETDNLVGSLDVSDALAVAICHLNKSDAPWLISMRQ